MSAKRFVQFMPLTIMQTVKPIMQTVKPIQQALR